MDRKFNVVLGVLGVSVLHLVAYVRVSQLCQGDGEGVGGLEG